MNDEHDKAFSPGITDDDMDEPGAAAAGLSPKQRREKRADEFIRPENTVLNKLVKKKDP